MRTFKAPNGNTLTAIDDIQADAMLNGGMVEISKAEAKALAKAALKEKTEAAAKENQETDDKDPSISDESDAGQDEEPINETENSD